MNDLYCSQAPNESDRLMIKLFNKDSLWHLEGF